MFFFSKSKSSSLNLKGRVHCNEICSINSEHLGQDYKARLRELNWLGMVVDQVEAEHFEAIHELGEKEELEVSFKLPREFGRINVVSKNYLVTKYLDVTSGKEKLQLDFNIEDDDLIGIIREFVDYRNKRFNRHLSKRRSKKFITEERILLWIIYIPVLLLALFCLYAYIANKYFPSAL
ncbi:MAG: hypothetical protein HQL32_06490 [Planctomycetes bacterium]|nr:hypothetical protein [Planctomycetota bacterium]